MKNLVQIQQRLGEIEQRGFLHVALSGQPAGPLRAMVEREGIGFPVLVDPGAAVMKALAVYNRFAPLKGHHIPHPSLVVIDREGRLRFHGLRKRILGRIGAAEILEILDR